MVRRCGQKSDAKMAFAAGLCESRLAAAVSWDAERPSRKGNGSLIFCPLRGESRPWSPFSLFDLVGLEFENPFSSLFFASLLAFGERRYRLLGCNRSGDANSFFGGVDPRPVD